MRSKKHCDRTEAEISECLAKCYALILGCAARSERETATGEALSREAPVAETPAQQSEASPGG